MTGRDPDGDGTRRASEDRFRELVDQLPEPFLVLRNGVVFYANAAALACVGLPDLSLALGHSIFDGFVHPDDHAMVEQQIRNMRPGERQPPLEVRFYRMTGELGYMEETSIRLEFEGELSEIVVGRDITERKRIEFALRDSEEKLRQSEAQLKRALQIAVMGTWEIDLETGVVTRSKELCRILGVSHEEGGATSRDWLVGIVHPDDRPQLGMHQRDAFDMRQAYTADYRVLRADGVRDIRSRGEVVRDEHGKAIRIAGIAQDVTDRKQLEARLALSDRMASLGTLAAGVAHEINNPLASLTANLDLMGEELQAVHEQSPSDGVQAVQDMVEEARAGADRVGRIVRGLKTFSRDGEERRGAVEIASVLEHAVNLTFNEVRHRARLVKDLSPVPLVMADEGRLGQVFINLLVNAAQALPDGGAHRNEIRIVTFTGPAGQAVVEVRDTGPGIPPHLLGRIFDPFFTTKDVGKGTGLGLSICHGIVTSLGGTIHVESEPGKVTVFRVMLPPATSPLKEATPAPKLAARALGRRGRVLVIDDDAAVGGALRRVLGKEHDVTLLASGQEAVARVAAGETFDVVLCDLMMPEMTGMAVHAELMALSPALAEGMIFITGGAFSPAAKSFLDAVRNRRFEKPFDLHVLREVVRDRVKARE